MKSSRSQVNPGRVIAEFGQNGNSADFIVREIVAEDEDPDDRVRFAIEDADTIGGVLAEVELRPIDAQAGEAELDLKIGAHTNDLAYELTVNNMRDAIRAMLERHDVETVHIVDTNLNPDKLELVAARTTNNVVELVLPEEPAAAMAMAA